MDAPDGFPDAGRRTVQDDSREIQLANMLRLQRSRRRIGSDARDEQDRRFELKTVTTDEVTTARDLGPSYIDRLRQSYLVVAKGTQNDYGFVVRELWVLDPPLLEGWIQDKVERHWTFLRNLIRRVLETLRTAHFEDAHITTVERLLQRGLTLNNPKISMTYIRDHGVQLAGEDVAALLRRFCDQHPLQR